MVKFRIINGKRVPLPGNDDPGWNPKRPSQNSTSSPFDDEYNHQRREEFARKQKEEFAKKIKENEQKRTKPQSKFEKAIQLNLGSAKAFMIKATPVLVQLDPTLSSVYTGYKVGKYGYCFLKQVNDDYQTSGNFEESLEKVARHDIEEKITSKLKSIPLQKGSQYAANMVWTFCKEKYSDGKIDPKWDTFGQNALAKTFEEIGGKLL